MKIMPFSSHINADTPQYLDKIIDMETSSQKVMHPINTTLLTY